MELFHASVDELKVGDVIKSSRSSSFYPAASTEMDLHKPLGAPSRTRALYCADSDQFAVYFLMMENVLKEDIKLYKVKVKSFHKAPFAITHVIEGKLNKSEDVSNLIKEYWFPSKNWHFYEYLTMEFEVIAIIDLPWVDQIVISHQGGLDNAMAKTIS